MTKGIGKDNDYIHHKKSNGNGKYISNAQGYDIGTGKCNGKG